MKKLLHFMLLLFVIGISNAQTPIYQFNFDGSLASTSGSSIFTSNLPVTYGTDRNGIANNTIRLQGAVIGSQGFQHHLAANLSSMPIGNAARSISLWVKCFSDVNNTNVYPFGYGSQTPNQAFGLQQNLQNSNSNQNRVEVYGFGPVSNNIGVVASAVDVGQWYHYVITHDGVNTTKIYRNNSLLLTSTKTWNTTGTLVTVGKIINGTYNVGNAVNGFIDDLKIYNVALTATQVAALYNTTSSVSLPVITNVSSSLIHEGANVAYTVNAGGASTTTSVLFDFNNTANGFAATGTTASGTSNTICTATTQFNLSAVPAGSTIYYKIQATNSAGTVFSPIYTYTQVAKPTYTLDALSNLTTNSVQINYTLRPNGANSTSVIKYGTTLGTYPNTVTGFSALGFTPNFNGVQLNGLTSNTTYYLIIEGTNAYGVSQSSFETFTTLGNAPIINNVTISNIQQTTATVNFSLNTDGFNITTVVNYGIDPNNLNLSSAGPTINSTTATNHSINLAGLTANTTYYYNIVLNGNGVSFTGIDSFTTSANTPVPAPIYNFEFNNNLQSQDGSVTLSTPISGSYAFVTNGTVANGALEVINARTQTSLPNLPLGSSNRSVHMRVKFATGSFPGENYLFNWGSGNAGQAFAFHQTATTAKLLGWGGTSFDYDNIPSSSAGESIWYEYVCTYDGTTMKVYRNGTLLGSKVTTLNTVGDAFRIGVNNSGILGINADIDYIRIFNQALTAGQVTQIYNNPSLLSSDGFSINNLKFNLNPNPAQDILNIEMEKDLKFVEIYSLQGQKIFSGNDITIDITNLSSGMYIVRVQDIDGAIATKKLMVK